MIEEIVKELAQEGIWKQSAVYAPITVGAGGARLYQIEDGDATYVLKVAHASFIAEKERLESYQKELEFYLQSEEWKLSYLPKLVYAQEHAEFGILIVMKHYQALTYQQWDDALQKKAVDLCAKINSIPVKELQKIGIYRKPAEVSEAFLKQSYEAWRTLAQQYRDKLPLTLIDNIYSRFEDVTSILNSEPQYVCHGDFHPENILFDHGELLVCDWQSVQIGKAVSDISFFMSRGIGFGIKTDDEALMKYYRERLAFYTGVPVEAEELWRERSASTLFTTFLYWSFYLKGAPFESIEGHYVAMKGAAEVLGIV